MKTQSEVHTVIDYDESSSLCGVRCITMLFGKFQSFNTFHNSCEAYSAFRLPFASQSKPIIAVFRSKATNPVLKRIGWQG